MHWVVLLFVLTIHPATCAELPGNAAGLCCAEVISSEILDNSAFDGLVSVKAKLKIVKSTGKIKEEIVITKEYGGLTVPGSPPPPLSDLARNLITKQIVWLAFAADGEVVAWWPADAPTIKELEAAVGADRYQSKSEK